MVCARSMFTKSQEDRADASRGNGPFPEDREEPVKAFRLGLILVDGHLEEFLELAAERPVPGELAETVEIGLAHVAAEVELLALWDRSGSDPSDPRERPALRDLLERDEVIHEPLPQ